MMDRWGVGGKASVRRPKGRLLYNASAGTSVRRSRITPAATSVRFRDLVEDAEQPRGRGHGRPRHELRDLRHHPHEVVVQAQGELPPLLLGRPLLLVEVGKLPRLLDELVAGPHDRGHVDARGRQHLPVDAVRGEVAQHRLHDVHTLLHGDEPGVVAVRDAAAEDPRGCVLDGGEPLEGLPRHREHLLHKLLVRLRVVRLRHDVDPLLLHQHQDLRHRPRPDALLHVRGGFRVVEQRELGQGTVPVKQRGPVHVKVDEGGERENGVHAVHEPLLLHKQIVRDLIAVWDLNRLSIQGEIIVGLTRLLQEDDAAAVLLGVHVYRRVAAPLDAPVGADAVHHARHHLNTPLQLVRQLLHTVEVVLARIQDWPSTHVSFRKLLQG
mmetsp:Transcript_10242/g.24439  ORF Transcript_10242/g.24439 Transcript_10242/m.24439 type:complete len:381 (-) Transcript_10242:883-2025(-)